MGIRREAKGGAVSGEQFNSPVLFIIWSPCCTTVGVKDKPWKSQHLSCVLSTQTKGISASDRISHFISSSRLPYLFSPSVISSSICHTFLSMLLRLSKLFDSRHATNIRHRPWPHFLYGCSLLSSRQGATSATIQRWRRLTKMIVCKCIVKWIVTKKCIDTKAYIEDF